MLNWLTPEQRAALDECSADLAMAFTTTLDSDGRPWQQQPADPNPMPHMRLFRWGRRRA